LGEGDPEGVERVLARRNSIWTHNERQRL